MEYKHFDFVGAVYSDYEYGETVYVLESEYIQGEIVATFSYPGFPTTYICK